MSSNHNKKTRYFEILLFVLVFVLMFLFFSYLGSVQYKQAENTAQETHTSHSDRKNASIPTSSQHLLLCLFVQQTDTSQSMQRLFKPLLSSNRKNLRYVATFWELAQSFFIITFFYFLTLTAESAVYVFNRRFILPNSNHAPPMIFNFRLA